MRPIKNSTSDHFINEEIMKGEAPSIKRMHELSGRRKSILLGSAKPKPHYKKFNNEGKFNTSIPSGKDFLLRTKKNEIEQLSEKIATSVQNRIDKATLENREQAKADQPSSKKSHTITIMVIVSGLIATGILIYVFKRSATPKPKTIK